MFGIDPYVAECVVAVVRGGGESESGLARSWYKVAGARGGGDPGAKCSDTRPSDLGEEPGLYSEWDDVEDDVEEVDGGAMVVRTRRRLLLLPDERREPGERWIR